MATISYSISGEGRGHAARARVVIDRLRRNHRLIIYCYGDAWDLLTPICAEWDIEVRRIPGLRFAYDRHGRLSRTASFAAALPYLAAGPEWILRLARELERDAADLALVDFEPLLPRAAQMARLPCLSLDHQRFLISCDLRTLPPHLLRQANLLGALSLPFYASPSQTIISSFFSAPLKPKVRNVRQVGVLLRPEVEEAEPTMGDHLVAYVRRTPPKEVMRALSELGHPIKVYGPRREGRDGLLEFRPIDPQAFADDLASCRALVTTAGNQVVGEALSLRKPVLAFPEPGNVEQEINGHFLSESGSGQSVDAATFSKSTLKEFLDRRDVFAARIETERVNGNALALGAIEAAAGAHRTTDWRRSGAPGAAAAEFSI